MKPPQFFITLILSSICVVLSLVTIWQGHSLNDLQNAFQDQQLADQSKLQGMQAEINRGGQIQQIYTSLIKDIASVSYDSTGKVRNDKLKDLLAKNGFNVSVPTPTPQPNK